MKLDDIIALGQQMQRWHKRIDAGLAGNFPHPETREFVDAVLALLTAESPCIASVEDIVRVDSDGYITIYQNESMRADEAAWAGVEVLRAVEKAREADRG